MITDYTTMKPNKRKHLEVCPHCKRVGFMDSRPARVMYWHKTETAFGFTSITDCCIIPTPGSTYNGGKIVSHWKPGK